MKKEEEVGRQSATWSEQTAVLAWPESKECVCVCVWVAIQSPKLTAKLPTSTARISAGWHTPQTTWHCSLGMSVCGGWGVRVCVLGAACSTLGGLACSAACLAPWVSGHQHFNQTTSVPKRSFWLVSLNACSNCFLHEFNHRSVFYVTLVLGKRNC